MRKPSSSPAQSISQSFSTSRSGTLQIRERGRERERQIREMLDFWEKKVGELEKCEIKVEERWRSDESGVDVVNFHLLAIALCIEYGKLVYVRPFTVLDW